MASRYGSLADAVRKLKKKTTKKESPAITIGGKPVSPSEAKKLKAQNLKKKRTGKMKEYQSKFNLGRYKVGE